MRLAQQVTKVRLAHKGRQEILVRKEILDPQDPKVFKESKEFKDQQDLLDQLVRVTLALKVT